MAQMTLTAAEPRDKSFLYHLRQLRADTIAFLEDLAQQGDFVEISLPGPGGIYYVNHPDLVREVLVTQGMKFQKPAAVKIAAWGIFGYNMFTSDGDVWRVLRKAVQPAFHSSRINAYTQTMVQYTQATVERWEPEQTLDVPGAMMELTLGITTKALFDADLRNNAAGDAIVRFIELFNEKASSVLPMPLWVPTAANREIRDLLSVRENVLMPIIRERRESGEDRGDLLSMLLVAQQQDDSGILTDDQVYNEISNLFAAGYEVVAHTTAFTLYLLSQNPDAEQKLLAEIDRVLGKRPITPDDLPQLPYLEMVVKESMRLLPATTVVARQAAENVSVGGHDIAKNSTVLVAPWTLHRREDIFPNPLVFEPERFSAEREPDILKHAYIPFSAGPRVCIGNAFAMLQLRVTLATLLQHYQFETPSGYTFEPMYRFNTRPKDGLPMVLRPRA